MNLLGFIPLTSYNEGLLKDWLTDAATKLHVAGLNIIFHSGDNSTAHRSHFESQLSSYPVFPLRDWHYGINCKHRKLIL